MQLSHVMAKVKNHVDSQTGEVLRVGFKCPGCGYHHLLPVNKPDSHPSWSFNNDFEKPTFSPSILMKAGHYDPGHPQGTKCWCDFNREHPEDKDELGCVICHSFVTEGKIQFLSDCTHALAGQTVELPDY